MSQENVHDENKNNSSEKLNIELPTKIGNENDEAIKKQFILDNTKLEDFTFLGKYTLFVCVFSELMILCQLSNMYYMSYAGYFFNNKILYYYNFIILNICFITKNFYKVI